MKRRGNRPGGIPERRDCHKDPVASWSDDGGDSRTADGVGGNPKTTPAWPLDENAAVSMMSRYRQTSRGVSPVRPRRKRLSFFPNLSGRTEGSTHLHAQRF
jgi:hypothetical protein